MPFLLKPEPFSKDPDLVWREWFATGKRVCKKMDTLVKLDESIYTDKVRFVCISDTHEKLRDLLPYIPNGDILVHCGDFTNTCSKSELEEFNDAIGQLPHTHKIVIAGNHELGFEEDEILSKRYEKYKNHGTSKEDGYKILSNCTMLDDSMVVIYGIKIYGASWHPLEGFPYFRPRGQPLLEKWNLIPEDTDVLLTHTPPIGHGDLLTLPKWDAALPDRWGDVDLLNTIEKRVKPKFHIFGHLHENTGLTTNGETIFINASICGNEMEALNKPILFDLPLKPGYKKC